MHVPYTKSGTRGDTTFARNRYGQISYPWISHVPFNPRTPLQMHVRKNFAAISARWRQLTEAQRQLWLRAGPQHQTRMRLGRGPLPGYNYFVQINVLRVNRGLSQVDVPPEYAPPSEPAQPARELRALPLAHPAPVLHANRNYKPPLYHTTLMKICGWQVQPPSG